MSKVLVEDAVTLMRPQAEAKGMRLVTTLERLSSEPEIDRLAVQQALINLLDNAIKFAPRESEVRVILRESGENWYLEVRDEGAGIPAKDQQRIFDRFVRLENELRRETQGAGIGLSLVRHIVEAHQGRGEVESREGEGSRFILRFPKAGLSNHG